MPSTKSPAPTYAYAVIDGNEAPDQYRRPRSCHHTLDAADRAARRLGKGDPNEHWLVIAWDDTRAAKLRPAPHQPADARRARRRSDCTTAVLDDVRTLADRI